MPLQLSLFDVPPVPPRPSGRILIAHGARAAETLLLERLDALLAEVRRDPSLLARPVRIVVPSRSLRLHVAAALVRRRGRSVAGVAVQTLFGLASEILERAGEPVPRGALLLDVLAQRAARAEPPLRRGLEDLADGFAAVTGTVRDLLDAGLEPIHAEAAEEALAADGPLAAGKAAVERARALVRSAARVEAAMDELGLGRASTLLRRAAERIETDAGEALPSRSILVHGFADATGVATDLIQALLRRCGAWLILDHPPKPEAPEGEGFEREFTARFAERLTLSGGVQSAAPASGVAASRIEAFEAVGADAEAREVARRARALLDGGARPEGIGIVARDLDPYRFALRRHLGRLGIPFSGVGETGALEPAGRRAQALLELLRDGEAVPSDRWLDAVAALPEGAHSPALRPGRAGGWVDLRLAFAALGAGRLRDATELRLEEVLKKGSYALPIRQGLQTVGEDGDNPEDGGGEGVRTNEAHARRRRIPGALIRAAVRAARRTQDRLASWPAEAAAADHLARLRSLLTADLGWDLDAEEAGAVRGALAELEREVPPRFRLERDELRLLLEDVLESAGASALGGRGGGVQVLSVTESRGRTFDHLFVAGLNRDVFPRGIREDPLLSDDLRRILQRVLPDVPVKRAGFDEERYLFAQLLSASPAATLSWQTADDDGKPLPASPLVERLRRRLEVARAPLLWSLPKAGPLPGARTAAEHAVMAGLYAPRRWWGRVMTLAIREARAESPSAFELSPERLAAARLAVLEEMDPDLRTPEGRAARFRLGPYFGFIGKIPGGGEGEPRLRDLYVTQLENLAACPWQLFLVRLLRVEPTPDPLGALPDVDPVLLGNAVHATLERISRPAGRERVRGGVRDLDPVAVSWPDERDVQRVLREESRRLLEEEGIFLPGLANALAERAYPLLATARDMDWSGGAVPVLATEVEGELDVGDAPGSLRHVLFQADRVDRAAGGLVVWTDYKTGKPISEARRPDARRRHFLDRVRRGTHLQAVAYLLGSEGESMGRYLFLRPGLDDEQRELSVTTADQDFVEAFALASEAVLAAWEAGSFFPRLVELDGRKEPGRCGYCSVAEACLRHDSGARQRLYDWTVAAGLESLTPEQASLLRVWRLGTHPMGTGGEGSGS